MIGHLVVGPAEHGVVRFGCEVVAGLRAQGGLGPVVRTTAAALGGDAGSVLSPLAGASLVHVQYTDRLLAPRCEESAALFEVVAAELARDGGAVSVTLHDLPVGTADPLDRRRAAAYRRVADRCVGVVVSSRHERARLASFAPAGPPVRVIALPVDAPADRTVDLRPVGDVTVLGFLYPGKGYEETLRALPPGIGLVALGRPSDGHEGLGAELGALAHSVGRSLRITGFVPDAALPALLRAAGIPVAPHRAVSASGSIATWLGAGRRPLVPDVAYTRELDERWPGAVWRYPADSLAATIAEAVAAPARTWLGETPVGPSTVEVAAAYQSTLDGWA